ncbi:spermidine synthase [Spinactinospora alkalitolerans]|uniref:Spermidine synthase n=1 Tax=Spinactinospora alkalitolerans TaxID=687207 RepID=A0A852TRI4_9ACTN|nr:fused MFS/spermidine synthase [Spinactinospora alkalitolerans]NYE46165.1 spermidine synthase [Spinactinospora alkalitolerans]
MNRILATAVVILSSAVVLVLEVAVVRLAAPYAGDTLETYTAAIGVALGAIALGAKYGGDAADRRPPLKLLGPLLVFGGGLTMLARPIVLGLGPSLTGAGPITALLLVASSIALPVALLSAVTPVVVKTQLADLDRTGSIVGRFSAWGTVGALAGTFLTGYVLIAAFPVSVVLLATGGGLIAFGGFLLLRHGLPGDRRQGPAMLAVALLGAGLLVGVRSPCDAETAYYCARVESDPDRPSGRVLVLDDLRHGYVDLDDPGHLEFGYTQWFGAAIETLAPEGGLSALHVGGGAYTLPRWLAETRPGSDSEVFEVDPAVTEMARTELGLRTGPELSVRHGDARIAITGSGTGAYDVVVGDAFGGLSVPWHLTTREFATEIHRVLRPGGVYVANIIDRGPRDFLAAEVATLATVFDHVRVIGHRDGFGSPAGGNHVIVAADDPIETGALERAVADAEEPGRLVEAGLLRHWIRDGMVLTDDHAPVDQLLTPYLT